MEHFMEDALANAQRALANQEVPVGCVFVYQNEIIAEGANLVNDTKNATRHAELICIDEVLSYCRERNLPFQDVFRELSVVVTVEPCIMCAGALNELNVKEIIFGCRNDRFGGQTVLNVFELLESKIKVDGGVREDEAMELLKEFYKGQNPSAPVCKFCFESHDNQSTISSVSSAKYGENAIKPDRTNNGTSDKEIPIPYTTYPYPIHQNYLTMSSTLILMFHF